MNRNSDDYDIDFWKNNLYKGEGKFNEYVKFKSVQSVKLIEGLAVLMKKSNTKYNKKE